MSESKKEIALEAYRKGSNCAQAVVTAFAPEMNLKEEQARALFEGFGGGFGGVFYRCRRMTFLV